MIYALGDSHIHILAGYPKLELGSEWIGDLPDFRVRNITALAYSVGTEGHRIQGQLNEALKQCVIGRVPVVLMYGEIDCRLFLLKQSFKQMRPLDEVVLDCVTRYFVAGKKLVEKHGHIPVFWGPVPVGPKMNEVPHFGTIHEVNSVKRLFNLYLRGLCRSAGVPFVTAFFEMMNDGTAFRDKCFLDGNHVSSIMVPYIIRLFISEGIDVGETMRFLEREKSNPKSVYWEKNNNES